MPWSKKTTKNRSKNRFKAKTVTRRRLIVFTVFAVAVAGGIFVYLSFAGGFDRKNIVAEYKNTDLHISGTGGVRDDKYVKKFKSAGTRGWINIPVMNIETSSSDAEVYSGYKLKIKKTGVYSLCQFGFVNKTAGAITLKISGESLATVKDGNKNSLSKDALLYKSVPSNSNEVPRAENLLCSDSFETVDKNAEIAIKIYVSSTAANPAKLSLSKIYLIKPIEAAASGDEITKQQKNENCLDGTSSSNPRTGTRVIGGSIKDAYGNPVSAQLGIDYTHHSDISRGDRHLYPIDNYPGNPYEDLLVVNTGEERGLTKWCIRVPNGVGEAFLEIYPKEKYDDSRQFVLNDAYEIGGANKKINIDSLGYKKDPNLGDTYYYPNVDITMPSACSAADKLNKNLLYNKYKTGDIEVEVKLNGKTASGYDMLEDDRYELISQPSRSIAWPGPVDSNEVEGYNAVDFTYARYKRAALLLNLAPQSPGYRVKTELVTNTNRYHVWVKDVPVVNCNTSKVVIDITDDNPASIPARGKFGVPTGCSVVIKIEGYQDIKKDCDSKSVAKDNVRIKDTQGVIKIDKKDDSQPNYDFDYFP